MDCIPKCNGVENRIESQYKFKNLDDVRAYLDNVQWINHGGCAIAALAMYRWLKVNGQLTPDTKFAYLYNWTSQAHYQTNLRALEGADIKPSSCSHAVLIFNGRYLDSETEQYPQDFSLSHTIDTEDFMLASINNIDQWNYKFDRSRNIRSIERDLGISLQDVKLN